MLEVAVCNFYHPGKNPAWMVFSLPFLPVVSPAVMALGFDSIWFWIIVVKMTEVCLITPPLASTVLTIIGLLAFPEIVTWLPNLVN